MRTLTLAALAAALALPASAATVTTSLTAPDLTGYSAANLSPSQFTTLGRCGYGKSLVGDGCQVAEVTTPGGPTFDYGRPARPIIDSQDAAALAWEAPLGGASEFWIEATDTNDQADSFFSLTLGGESWNLSGEGRRENGNSLWIHVSLEGWEEGLTGAFESVGLLFSTKREGNDGYSLGNFYVADLPPAPVPLPAGGLLLAGALGLLVARKAVR